MADTVFHKEAQMWLLRSKLHRILIDAGYSTYVAYMITKTLPAHDLGNIEPITPDRTIEILALIYDYIDKEIVLERQF
jgi:hypothetical protein